MVCSCTLGCGVALLATLVYFVIFRKRVKFDPSAIRGKRVLVTGAASGIGEQVAYKYAELGAKLLITDFQAQLLDKVAIKCKQLGATAVHSVTADMTNASQRDNLVAETHRILGGLDHLLLIHGVMKYGWIKGTDQFNNDLKTLFEVNFFSHADITGKLLKMLEESRGAIGIISSLSGKLNSPGLSAYGSTKATILNYYQALRQELIYKKTGVTVSIMVYGPIATERFVEFTRSVGSKFDVAKRAGKKQVAAQLTVESVSTGQYETQYPTSTKLVIGLHKLFPRFIEDKVAYYANKGKESYIAQFQ